MEKVGVEQREEIARLKGLKGRATIKPSGMDKGTEPPKLAQKAKRVPGEVTPRVRIEHRVLQAEVPHGFRFRGYELFLVQDLLISASATCYQRERWVTPNDLARRAMHPHIGHLAHQRRHPLQGGRVGAAHVCHERADDVAAQRSRCLIASNCPADCGAGGRNNQTGGNTDPIDRDMEAGRRMCGARLQFVRVIGIPGRKDTYVRLARHIRLVIRKPARITRRAQASAAPPSARAGVRPAADRAVAA